MPYDVFISHASEDKLVAQAVCNQLESVGVRCWIAPRDVDPGEGWSAAILKGIETCRIMVLVFSDHANESPHIRREVAHACSHELVVIPMRIRHTPPKGNLQYYLDELHWLDALTPPLQKHLETLTARVTQLLSAGAAKPEAAQIRKVVEKPRRVLKSPSTVIAIVILALGAIGMSILFSTRRKETSPNTPIAAQTPTPQASIQMTMPGPALATPSPALAERDADNKPTSIDAGLTSSIDSVKMLYGKLLQVYLRFENQTTEDVTIYVGNPTEQYAPPPQQGLEVSLTDNARISYWVLELDGVTKVEQRTDPHAIYAGWNQYLVVPAEGRAQVRFVFKPNQASTENPASVNLGAQLGIVADLKSRKVIDKYLSVQNHKIDSSASPTRWTEESKKKPITLPERLTATIESAKVFADQSLEILLRLGNQGENEATIYMGNPSQQWARPPNQGLAISVTDNIGSSYWLKTFDGAITRLAAGSRDPHAIYTGVNQFVTVQPKNSSLVRFAFLPKPSHNERVTSIDFTSELRIVTDSQNRNIFDWTLNVLDWPVD
jgi:hypothetical protein